MIEDFFPTILEMAGVTDYETVQTVDGHSFVDVIKNPGIQRDRTTIWHFPNRWGESQDKNEGYGAYSAILKGDYHLIYSGRIKSAGCTTSEKMWANKTTWPINRPTLKP